MPYRGCWLSSSLRQGCHFSPGVPTTAAAKRWTWAPRASAAMAVRSSRPLRGWALSTSCSPRTSASRSATAFATRSACTVPSDSDLPCKRLNVARRTSPDLSEPGEADGHQGALLISDDLHRSGGDRDLVAAPSRPIMRVMTDDLIAELESQERELVLDRFDNGAAWRLGSLLVELASDRGLPVAIDIRRGAQ